MVIVPMPSVTSSSGLKGLVVAASGGILLYSAIGNVGISTEVRDLIAGKNPRSDLETGPDSITAGPVDTGVSQQDLGTLVTGSGGTVNNGEVVPPPVIAKGNGSALSVTQIYRLATQAGFPILTAVIATAVALAESSGHPNDINDDPATGDLSYGLWQINMIGDLGPARRKTFGISSNDQLLDPATNAKAAYILSNHGLNFNAWSTFKNGAYKKYLAQAYTAYGK